MFALAAVVVSGCGGSGGHFANNPRPPSPVNVSVYINDQRVSLSPTSVGAGPLVFVVTNQASQAVSMTILPAGSAAAPPLADTGPISPQATAQITVDFFDHPHTSYKVATSATSSTQAAAATTTPIRPAILHIGEKRPSASHQLMSP
jgi:hypothetical protein